MFAWDRPRRHLDPPVLPPPPFPLPNPVCVRLCPGFDPEGVPIAHRGAPIKADRKNGKSGVARVHCDSGKQPRLHETRAIPARFRATGEQPCDPRRTREGGRCVLDSKRKDGTGSWRTPRIAKRHEKGGQPSVAWPLGEPHPGDEETVDGKGSVEEGERSDDGPGNEVDGTRTTSWHLDEEGSLRIDTSENHSNVPVGSRKRERETDACERKRTLFEQALI